MVGKHTELTGDGHRQLLQAYFDVPPVRMRNSVDLIHQIDPGGGRRQQQNREQNHLDKMIIMQYDTAQPGRMLLPLEASGWKTALNWAAAVALSLLFLVAGVWKISDPSEAAVRMAQVRVPQSL